MPFGSTKGLEPILESTIQQISVIGRAIPEDPDEGTRARIRHRRPTEMIEHQLLHRLPETTLPVNLFGGSEAETVIDTNLSVAWQIGTHIFYENCINKDCGAGAGGVMGMDAILECLDRVEDIKVLFEPDIELRDEPITWPAFVASCNASTSRQAWSRWWERVGIYGSKNIDEQWNLIQGIWGLIDRRGSAFNWVSFLEGEGDGLVPLDIVIESLGMDGMNPIWYPPPSP